MPSFDIVCRIDYAELDNALNNTKKAMAQRFDFRGATAEITVDKKEKKLHILTEDKSKQEAIRDMFVHAAVKRGFSPKAFEFKETEPGAAGKVKRDVKLKDGLEQDASKDIVKRIKAMDMKVQASIQGEEIRVTAKKIDDLQAVIAMLKAAELELPLDFVNMKS